MEEISFSEKDDVDESEECSERMFHGSIKMNDMYDDEESYDMMDYGDPECIESGVVYDSVFAEAALDPLFEVSENTLSYDEEGTTDSQTIRPSSHPGNPVERKFASSLTGGGSEPFSLLPGRKGDNLQPSRLEPRRRKTISGPRPANESDLPLRSSRRRNLYRPSLTESLADSSVSSDGNDSSRPKSRNATVFAVSRISTRRNTLKRETSKDSLTAAVDRLAENSNDWENVAAAAAVVAASTHTLAKRSLVQFSRGDHVLVMLTLLNITNQLDDKDMFTTDPVNCFGYAAGEGTNEAQRHGPYKYLLCHVQTVHFDEDERYYTVTRMDTGSQQRADPGWMEPIKDPRAIERALRAARRTPRSQDAPKAETPGLWFWLAVSPLHFLTTKALPFYKHTKRSTKRLVESIVHGKDGYELRFRCTAINFLVLCSLIYLFVDVVALAFLSTETDFAVSAVAAFVWLVLLLELLFECMIRPSNYFSLLRTDKAYAPLTARNINRFHLGLELIALLIFVPSMLCIMTDYCEDNIWFNGVEAALSAVKSENAWRAAIGRFNMNLTFLRCFGPVRHWKQMWIAHTLEGKDSSQNNFTRKLFLMDHDHGKRVKKRFSKAKANKEDDETEITVDQDVELKSQSKENDQQLKNAATIGTALTVLNSHRALFILLAVVAILPSITTLWKQNPLGTKSLDLLMAYNIAANSTDDCEFLQHAVSSWLSSVAIVSDSYVKTGNYKLVEDVYVLWAEMRPVRCDWQRNDGVITKCDLFDVKVPGIALACDLWNSTMRDSPDGVTNNYLASQIGIRTGEALDLEKRKWGMSDFYGSIEEDEFYVRSVFNESHAVALAYLSLFLQLFGLLMLSLVGLTVLREDAGRLVLGPLQRMLMIVVRYAENPLSLRAQRSGQRLDEKENESKEELGNYETEQLINAIAKIADLLRKCWGVAGAGIISSNLARTKDGKTVVFNPTVPGKSVYALFGFVAINDFSKQLRVLGDDVMKLINDVARVVHDEVFRWALNDSGQCNKNLGAAFLMVFRIGDFSEVHEKQRRAAAVVFKGQQKKAVRSRKQRSKFRRSSTKQIEGGPALQLASLPGIQSFADRALLGLLKSFAGIHRDKHLREWEGDWRLGAGVGAFKVSVIYGMDAGWAVEGAVARSKLRHLDTVYVKGSSVAQRIYTYDCRFDGVDYFLYERTPEQADAEAAAYTQSIWDTDKDLQGMRQHVGDDFMEKFSDGVQHYLDGRWTEAVELLQDADDLMLRTVLEEGYVDHKADDFGGKLFDRTGQRGCDDEINRIRNDFGDGACKCLVQYMLRRKCKPPSDWNGVRALMSK
ncbi:hypothetical protein FisN_8Lh104 [Fistulifera solaris]|uniref:Guanylate cyclase domain-containing protein n=1 Tax=Fistulifera solaris TaxID=1519565 RepID=A0A1Z5JDB8_FISSO|nr:hypothetical protein FisN_8Lh104 [Fistulifera solaris]|eukprot:GAX12010.1 hypothetical protein FisN_8Lh104 [Fistulifera solaris]